MLSEESEKRPDCFLILKERNKWITTIEKDEKSEYNAMFKRLKNSVNKSDESLRRYASYHLK